MLRSSIVPIGIAFASALAAQAQFAPLVLTPGSYSHDVVIEKEAPRRPTPRATTATLDGGTNNTGFTFYERGFNLAATQTGLPPAGDLLFSESAFDHSYLLPASYTAPNAILIDAGVTNGTYTVTTPVPLSGLSFLATSGGGAGVVTYKITFADNSTEAGQITVPDWFGGANPALTVNGRASDDTRALSAVNTGNPRLYSVDVVVTNSTTAISKIDFERVSGGHVGIFAVSGSTGADYNALLGTGFNHDLIIEATAARNIGATTATLDTGSVNTGDTWYEMGYNTNANGVATGLPAPGQTLTNASVADKVYRMAPTYTNANAIVIDSLNPAWTVRPANPTTLSAISFLGSSGNGAVTVSYTITHADATTQTGTFVVPDWFNATPVAYTLNGRANAVSGALSAVASGNPRLYGTDIAVNNTSSPVTEIVLGHSAGTGHAVIMAISAAAGAVRPIHDLAHPAFANAGEGGTVTFGGNVTGTTPQTYRWQVGTNGVFMNVTDGANVSGSTTTNLTLNNLLAASAADYILIAQNAAGSSTSRVTRVNVVSTKADVTLPQDTFASIGGTSPNAESVTNVVDDTTSKYLNFGLSTNGFGGPVGFTITPLQGSSIVTGLRIYAANDAPERDPVDYVLEGSTDGTNFSQISAGAVILPTARNQGGAQLDPLTQANHEIRFENAGGFTTYRLTFNNVRNPSAANSMQVGEVELLGTFGVGAPNVSIARNQDGTVTITSSQPGTLQSTRNLNPPIAWNGEGAIEGSRTIAVETTTNKFFRVTQPAQ